MSNGVSVVVPVYNPGDHIDRTITSLLEQSLPNGSYEIVFVDDGSTDGTGERLDRLAVDHPDIVRVEHIAHSGWPGKPRNVGTDLARFDYVFYCDADDWMPEDALETLLHRVEEDRSDVVVSRAVGNQRAVPNVIFELGDFATTWRDTPAVFTNLTCQKLFRREFLRSNGIRFPDGRTRLEDFVFVMLALLRSERISVLGSRPCYVLEARADRTNLTAVAPDMDDYFASIDQILDIVETHTAPGRDRDLALDRTLRAEIIAPVTGPGLLRRDEADRRRVFAHVRQLLRDRIPESAVAGLDATTRRRVQAIIDGDRALIEEWIAWDAAVGADIRFTAARWTDEAMLRLELDVAFVHDGAAIDLTRAGGKVFAPGPPSLEPDAPDLPAGVDVTSAVRPATVHIALRSRDIQEKWRVRAHVEPAPGAVTADRISLHWRATVEIDFRTVADGRPLRPQVWDPVVQVGGFGFSRHTRAGLADDVLEPEIAVLDGLPVSPYVTRDDKLAFDVGAQMRPFTADLVRRGTQPVSLTGSGLTVPVRLVVHGAPPEVTVTLVPPGDAGAAARPVRLPATVHANVSPGRLHAELPALTGAPRWTVQVATGDDTPVPLDVQIASTTDKHGRLAAHLAAHLAGAGGRDPSWRKRLLAVAERLGLTAVRIGTRAVLLSRSAGVTRSPLVPGASLLAHRSGTALSVVPLTTRAAVVASGRNTPPGMRAVPLTSGVTVVATDGTSGTDPPTVSAVRAGAGAWVIGVGEPEAAAAPDVTAVGRHGALVTDGDLSGREALVQETDTMRHLGRQHLAWLLDRYRIDCVLDIGANTGQYGLELRANGFTGHIVSVEPVPSFSDEVRTHAHADGNWSVHQVALGTEDGTVPIRVQRTFSSALPATEYGKRRFATLRQFADDEPVDVPLRRLDSVLDEWLAPVVAAGTEHPRVFLKMDTQGLDLQVFAGLGERVRDIVGLQSEVALLLVYEDMPRMPEALAVYETAGFELTGLYPVTREQDGRVIEYDCTMVRSDATVPRQA